MYERHLFGKDFQRTFYLVLDGEPIKLPSQTPTIYIFSSAPTRDEAQAGTGAVETITSWNQDAASPYGCTYTVSAIDDPSPDEATPEPAWYWAAISYVAETSEQTQTAIQAFLLERGATPATLPHITPADLIDVYPAINDYLEDEELRAQIAVALSLMITELEAKGIEWGKLGDLHKLKLALAFRAIALSSFSQVKEEGDKFHLRYIEFTRLYSTVMEAIRLPYDKDGNGKPEQVVEAKRSYAILDT